MDGARSVRATFVARLPFLKLWGHSGNGEDIELCPKEKIITRKYTSGTTSPDSSPDAESPREVEETNITTVDGGNGTDQNSDVSCAESSNIERSSVWQAGWLVINCMQGIGILSLPYTVKRGGVASLATMIVVLILGNYTSKMLVGCMYEDNEAGAIDESSQQNDKLHKSRRSKRRIHETYADIADACYKYGGHVINILQIVDMIAIAALYLQLSGALLVDTFPRAGISQLSWTIICTLVLFPTVFFKNLPRISWLSLVALLSLVVMYSSVLWYSFGRSIHWEVKTLLPLDMETYAISASVIVFNFGVQFLMPGVESSMEDRSLFSLMLNCSYIITGFLDVAYSLFAFLTFAGETQEFITYNMPLGPLQATVSCLFLIKSIFSYPLMIFLIVSTIDSMDLHFLPPCHPQTNDRLPPIWAIVFRVILVALTVALATLIPHFSLLMGVTGSLTAPWLDYIFPCIFYMKLKKDRIGLLERFLVGLIVLISVLAGIVGLFYSGKALIFALIQ